MGSIFDYNSDDVRSGTVNRPADARRADEQGQMKRRAAAKWIYILAVALLSVILAVVLLSSVVSRVNKGMVMELQVGDIAPSQHEDGQYSGSYSAAGMDAEVTVCITAGYIIDISLDGFSDIDASRARPVFSSVIAAQSLETGDDEIGSEPTDKILLMAIENALNGEEQ